MNRRSSSLGRAPTTGRTAQTADLARKTQATSFYHLQGAEVAVAGQAGRHGPARPAAGGLALAGGGPRPAFVRNHRRLSHPRRHSSALQVFAAGGPKSFQHQDVVPGVIQITPPGLPAHIVYARPYDILHFHIPNALLRECFDWSHRKWPTDGVVLRDPLPARDALLEKLGTTLLSIASKMQMVAFLRIFSA